MIYGPNQEDYRGDSQLVPGGLRVYRHYKEEGGSLLPTVMHGDAFGPGVNVAKCKADPSYLSDSGCINCLGKGWITLGYGRPFASDPLLGGARFFNYNPMSTVNQVKCTCLRECNAPRIECSCGFYASYSPNTDFFDSYAYRSSIYSMQLPPIFAVVEASGRVLMGSKGVRSEKMRVVAVSLDDSHIRKPAYNPYLNDGSPTYDDIMGSVAKSVESYSTSVYRNTLLVGLDKISAQYGIPSFETKQAMIQAFPQPDLSNLIENQENPHG